MREMEGNERLRRAGGDWETVLKPVVAPGSVHVGELREILYIRRESEL